MNIGDVLVALEKYVNAPQALSTETTEYEREHHVQQFVDVLGLLRLESHWQDWFEWYRAPRMLKCSHCGQRLLCQWSEDTWHLKMHDGPVPLKSPPYYCEKQAGLKDEDKVWKILFSFRIAVVYNRFNVDHNHEHRGLIICSVKIVLSIFVNSPSKAKSLTC